MLDFILLGVVQGLTEFLPISSSGHLALVETWLNIDLPGLLFEALLHLATVGSILLFFRRRVTDLVRHPGSKPARALWRGLVLATLPTAALGFLFKGWVVTAFETPTLVALGLLWTGGVLFVSERFLREDRALDALSPARLLLVGVAQGLAVFPGVSRSGMTIAAALLVGLPRQQAVEFSLFLAIPAILGATLLQASEAVLDAQAHQGLWGNYLIGMFVALASGVLAIGLLIRTLQRGRLHWFAYYCWTLGLGVLLWRLFADG